MVVLPIQRRPVALGLTIGLSQLTGLEFSPHKDYTFCCICGVVFQPSDPQYNTVEVRKRWSHRHARKHPDHEHNSLRISGRFCTPEAAIVLASYGIIPLTLDDEIEGALFESKPIPNDDAEGINVRRDNL